MNGALAAPLASKLEALPSRPGVYIVKGARGEIVYIGKAVNLRNRVRGYFFSRGADNHLASRILRDAARDLEWIVTATESEALILEANLAKKHSPRYNIELKDDKHYPYIRVSLSDPFPRFWVTRQAVKGPDAYFGPYTNATAMRKTIQLLNKVFRIRDCELKLPPDEPMRPCLTHHIGRCDAPCAFLTTQADYRVLVDEAMLFLKGKRKELLETLEGEMRLAAQERRFEEAAAIRDQLGHLRAVQERQRVDLGTDDAPKDLIAAARMGKVASLVVLEIRDGYLADRKQFEAKAPLEQEEGDILEDFVRRYYLDRDAAAMPREILISHPLPEVEATLAYLRERRGGPVDLDVPQRGEKRRQLDLSLENARVQLGEYLARRERKNRQNFMVEALQEDLGLDAPPKRIEGFDISHLSGTGTVASMVVFVDGKPSKKDYRKFNVKTVEGIDDFASMREVVGRRLRRLNEEDGVVPDLILIDGGKGQLGAALEALRETGRSDQPILGLAKRLEEVFLPGQSDPLMLPKTSAALRLLQQVRDEAHRFAVTFQRSKRKATFGDSWLARIPGIGEKTRFKLLREFRTVEAVKQADEAALAGAVGKAAAAKIKAQVEAESRGG